MSGRIVTFGIKPAAAATSYGYIRPGEKLNGSNALAVDGFFEKPDAETAARHVADGCLWNSGNFMFRADVMLNELLRFEPAIAKAAKAAIDGVTEDLDFMRLPAEPFAAAPRKSIDYAVMERTALAAVIPAEFGWSDIGSWDAVWDVAERDHNGNAVDGPAELLNTRDSLVHSDGHVLTAIIGCERMVVVSTSDAVLVASRDQAEKVKDMVNLLKAKNQREDTEHRRMYRRWGYYQSVDFGVR